MIKNNRDDFDQCTALVFDLLYKTFPKETDVAVDDLDKPLDENRTDNYFASIRFLQREGLIRYQEFYYSTFKGSVLTAKGLKVLDTKSEASAFNETVVQQLSQALNDNSEKAIKTIVQEIIKLSV
jgi:hypothetical protein